MQDKIIQKIELFIEQLDEQEFEEFIARLRTHRHESCNVAISNSDHPSHWPAQPDVFHQEINLKYLEDFRISQDTPDEGFENTILALMQYYEYVDFLQFTLLAEIFEQRPSYKSRTAQFAYDLRSKYISNSKNREPFQNISVFYDRITGNINLFCDKLEHSRLRTNSFVSRLVNELSRSSRIFIPAHEIPRSYVANPAVLKSYLRSNGFDVQIHCSEKGMTIIHEKIEAILEKV